MTNGRRMRWYARALCALVLAAGAGACGRLRTGGSEPALLIFRNDGLDQVSVYLAASEFDFRRIGTVMPGRTDTLRVPGDLTSRAGPVNIIARIFGRSLAPQTGPVTIGPGEAYEVRLSADQRMLSFLRADR